MFKNLSAGAIGIRGASLSETIRLARLGGFEGVDFSVAEAAQLAAEHGVEHVKEMFRSAGIRPGSWSLPVSWRGDEEELQAGLRELPRLAALGVQIGCNRTATWMLSWSDDRPYDENFAWHVRRYRAIAEILRDHGCRFGIEFLGPKTLRQGKKHEFIHTMDGLLDLAKAIGTGNVGLLLDAWHLYTSGGSATDVRRLTNDDVVTVHVNDAPAGVPVDEQIDNVRCLPMETGVVDLPGFLSALAAIGYDGPVTPEPFSKRVNSLPPEEAVKEAGESMRRAWSAAGL